MINQLIGILALTYLVFIAITLRNKRKKPAPLVPAYQIGDVLEGDPSVIPETRRSIRIDEIRVTESSVIYTVNDGDGFPHTMNQNLLSLHYNLKERVIYEKGR